jgi:hypothetical protein
MTAPTYVVGIAEVLCGGMLLAVTMALHGGGVPVRLRSVGAMQRRLGPPSAGIAGIAVLIVSSWMLVLLHLIEVLVWVLFCLLIFAWSTSVLPTLADEFQRQQLRLVEPGPAAVGGGPAES